MEKTLGKYKLVKMLGSGSFGAIWLAEDSWLEKKLALKIPHDQAADMRKTLAEPKLLASLDHPNIVRLITVDQVANKLFLVMEYIDGPDLRTALEKSPYPLNKMLGNVLIWKLKNEDYLRASGLDYTIVRPGGLHDNPGGEQLIVLEQGDEWKVVAISRIDVAAICVAALQYPEARNKTFEAFTVKEPPNPDWAQKFAGVK